MTVPATRDLPDLEWLLRFAESPEHIGDWRPWLLEQTVPGLRSLPVASISAYERIDGHDLDATWLATPVALEARLDHVRLAGSRPVASRRVRTRELSRGISRACSARSTCSTMAVNARSS